MTDFHAIAEQAVLARRVHRNMDADIARFVAHVGGTDNAIITIHRRTRSTLEGNALFDAVAMQAVIAIRGGQTFHTGVDGFIAQKRRQARISSVLTTIDGIAEFSAIAEQTIRASAVFRRVIALVRRFVAGIHSAGHAVVTVGIRSVLAAKIGVTGFRTIAELAILAQTVFSSEYAGVVILIAGIDGARDGVDARRGTGHAPIGLVARFHAVAEQSINAQIVICRMDANIVRFIAGVNRATDAVVTIPRRAGACTGDANVSDGAEQTVYARTAFVAGQRFASAGVQIADADRAIRNQTAAIHRRGDTRSTRAGVIDAAQIAVGARIAVIRRENATERRRASVIRARIAVTAQRIVRAVGALIDQFVAVVQRTCDAVIAVGRRSRQTGPAQADFNAVAEKPIVTMSRRQAFHARIRAFVAERG